jgi:hypothetical protein
MGTFAGTVPTCKQAETRGGAVAHERVAEA